LLFDTALVLLLMLPIRAALIIALHCCTGRMMIATLMREMEKAGGGLGEQESR